MRSPALENDYLSDDRAPSSDSALASVTVMAHNNQQDVRITALQAWSICMLYACVSLCVYFDLVTGLLLLQAVRVGSVCSNSGEFQFLLRAGM